MGNRNTKSTYSALDMQEIDTNPTSSKSAQSGTMIDIREGDEIEPQSLGIVGNDDIFTNFMLIGVPPCKRTLTQLNTPNSQSVAAPVENPASIENNNSSNVDSTQPIPIPTDVPSEAATITTIVDPTLSNGNDNRRSTDITNHTLGERTQSVPVLITENYEPDRIRLIQSTVSTSTTNKGNDPPRALIFYNDTDMYANDYYIDKRKVLGAGESAVVYQAIHIHTKIKYAAKVLDKLNAKTDDYFKIRGKEISILQNLPHFRHIANLFDVIEDDRFIILILTYANSGNLRTYLQSLRRCFTEDEARYVFKQIHSALEHAHANNVSHRDIKLENILLTIDCNYTDNSETKGNEWRSTTGIPPGVYIGNVLLCDWGLSDYTTELLKVYCGSPYYAAPEIILGIPYDGKKADVWSLGCLLYMLVVGRYPFGQSVDDDLDGVFQRTLQNNVKYPTGMSEPLKLMLSNMLVKIPTNRASLGKLCEFEWFKNASSQPIFFYT